MDISDFCSCFLIRIQLVKTVNKIHGNLISSFLDSCLGLSTIKRWRKDFDNGSVALEKDTSSRKTPGDEGILL
ncbi:Uncharacterized protein FKW44_022822 [Caligus rogercresseyi]|uniref:Mos1 transposase HTH domain-containing protein n=1 Tax=Caligus rogercresseyi TaxID=217165 RepID=A0A7T8GN10_CALRO|nr:Uncharacterized protein FKW44_022822 [Caligus rogercresseyi]